MFKNSICREWWGQVRGHWITVQGRRRRRFLDIVDEMWMSAGMSLAVQTSRHPSMATAVNGRNSATMPWCIVASIVAGSIVAARRRRRY
jgi:hypothetical protein